MNPLVAALVAQAMSPSAREFFERIRAATQEGLDKARAAAEEFDDEFDIESEGPGADDIVTLRKEWGERLLAEQAKVEEAGYRLEAALRSEEEAYRQLRVVTGHLQKVFAAYQLLHEALYGVGQQ